MTTFLDALRERVLLADGAMGTQVQSRDLDLERDYLGCENCPEVLNKTRPDAVRDIHSAYLAAGSDLVETNTFGGSPVTLGEFDLDGEALEINRRAAEIAREAVEGFAGDGRERFVLGAVGPGTKLPSLGQVDYQTLEDALAIQCRGLATGGVDAFLIETCQDPLQIKAAVNGAKRAREETGADLPIAVQVTVETTGTLLVGADIAAAATVIEALDVPMLGLNCATGPQEMAEHVKWLSENWTGLISVLPNAGLPELVDGQPHYPLSPEELAAWLERFVEEDGVNMIGGCCGTTEAHIAALDAMLRRRAEGTKGAHRPAPVKRSSVWVPSLASLYNQVPLRQEQAYLSIGERCNANGSRKFRRLQDNGDWEGCVAMGREQIGEGSHALDLCAAFVGRDEIADMTELMTRMRGALTAPLVIDSTELPVIESALKLYGGKAVINSINFENGEEPAAERLKLAKRFGAGVIALTIDEEGMAKSAEGKIEIARRLTDFARAHGLKPCDLIIDPLTFTICTGNEEDRKLALWSLEAIEQISRELPEVQLVLGVSNVSFGLNPAARQVLNSVFLDEALKRGLTGAIVHVSKILPLHKIAEEELAAAQNLIFDRREAGDPLQVFMDLFADRQVEENERQAPPASVEERLARRIVDGDRQGLDEDLDLALESHPPLDIINKFLLDGMREVGELFGAGKMQLPFVLRSAECMKAAVAHLEPHMEKTEGQHKGTIVVATVKGDVHDIGKNLVDIILTNNGYKVVNLGIKQPLANILAAAREHDADAIGMSGLLVKSTVVMRENLEEMTRDELDIPVILGGAALTRQYVEEDCARAYATGPLAYARDAFDGLSLMAKSVDGSFHAYAEERTSKAAERRERSRRREPEAAAPASRPIDLEEVRLRRNELARDVPVPQPPFWGPRIIEEVPLEAVLPYLNQRMLYQFHWGYRKNGRRLDEYMKWARSELRVELERVVALCRKDEILRPQAVYGYWPCVAEGDDLVLFDPDDRDMEVARFALPRQARENGLCISDFVRDRETGETDVIGLQAVTVGQRASDVARAWFAEDRYQDYLYLHGFGVEMAEALAEYVHKRIRAELGFAAEDARDLDKLLGQGYRGSRYSFGYPACPNLEDQMQLLDLLEAERVGISLSDEFQLEPEQSTSAIVLHHPEAKYFSV